MHGRTARAYAGDAIAEKTVAQGRGHATPDCHDIAAGPPRPYSRHGSKPIARVQWDDTYTDPHWNHTRLGRPDTIAINAPAHASPPVRDA